MATKPYLLILLICICFTARSQNFLRSNPSQIKKEMAAKGAKLIKNFVENGIKSQGDYREIIFSFPKPKSDKGGILNMTFDLTLNGKCFKYYANYYGDDWLNKLRDSLDKRSKGLKRVKDSLKWVDGDKRYQVRIAKYSSAGPKRYPLFIFEIEQTK